MPSGVFGFVVSLCVLCGFLLVDERLMHWFVLPVLCCGVLIGRDAVDWLRGRLDVYDPVGLLGLLGFHFFFLAPLLHVHWDLWMDYVTPPLDWRPWLGAMASLNLFGLLAYRFAQGWTTRRLGTFAVASSGWELNHHRFLWLLFWAVVIGVCAQAFLTSRLGSPWEQLSRFIGHAQAVHYLEVEQEVYRGLGVVSILASAVPLLLLLGATVFARRMRWARSALGLTLVLATFSVLRIIFGGLQGSRSHTVFGLMIAVGVIHLCLRPISRWLLLAGMFLVTGFMILAGAYRSYGVEGIGYALDPEAQQQLAGGPSVKGILLGDFGRSDVQAYVLYRYCTVDGIPHSWGGTYAAALALFLPSAVLPGRPPGKMATGTDVMFGPGFAFPGNIYASNVYGLAGEAMLNFGVVGVFAAFLVFGTAVALVRRWLVVWGPGDPRRLILPSLILLTLGMLFSDADNLVGHLISFIPLFAVVVMASNRQHGFRESPVVGQKTMESTCRSYLQKAV